MNTLWRYSMECNKTTGIIVVAAFVLGLIFGYGFSGKKEDRTSSAKDLLTQAIQEIDAMENDQQNLLSKLESSKRDTVVKKNKVLSEEIETERQKNENLQNEVLQLRGQVAHTELQLESKETLKATIDVQSARLTELGKSNAYFKGLLEDISSLTRQPLLAVPEQPAAEITIEQPATTDIQEAPSETDAPVVRHE